MEIIDGAAHLDAVKALIAAYTRQLGRDLNFQGIQEELADPGKKYTPPEGKLLVAYENGTVWGMVAYHRHSDTRCEMKRLYVRPECRGQHLGQRLVQGILQEAARDGYREMVLDTLSPMRAAIALYQKYGFQICPPYYQNPMADVIYMRKTLTA